MSQGSNTKMLCNSFPLCSSWRTLSLPTHSPSFSSWPGWQLSSCRQRKEPMVLTQCSLLWQVCLSVTHSLISVRKREQISATGCQCTSLFLLFWKEQKGQMKDFQMKGSQYRFCYSALMEDVCSPGSLVSTEWLKRHKSQGDFLLLPSSQTPQGWCRHWGWGWTELRKGRLGTGLIASQWWRDGIPGQGK